jgi:HAD superfamily hydrolase (TIGR01549 family)
MLRAVLLDFGNVFVNEKVFIPAASMGVVHFVKQRGNLSQDAQSLYAKLRATPQVPAGHPLRKDITTRELYVRQKCFVDFATACGVTLDQAGTAAMMTAYDDAAAESGLIEGTESALAALHAHYKLAVVSNGYAGFVRATLERYNLYTYLDHVVVSQEVNIEKPSVVMYQGVADALGVAFDECMMVGDGWPGDIVGPKDLGMATCWVNAPGIANPDPSMSDHEVHRLSELPPLLGL